MYRQYQTDILGVLIGTNPLPNYVAARLLLKEGGVLVLIHSPAINTVASQVVESLKQDINFTPIYIELSESDNQNIYSSVQKKFKFLYKEHPQYSIGLNYTGGTKIMAVHAYNAIRDTAQTPVMSYLDARDLTLKIDSTPHSPQQIFPVRDRLPLSLTNLISLHKAQIDQHHEFREKPLYPETAEIISKEVQKNSEKWKDVIHNKHHILKTEYPDIYNSLIEETEAPLTWLKGPWLESFTHKKMMEAAQELGLSGFKSYNSITFSYGRQQQSSFEIDVIGIRGYQIYGITCCSSKYNESTCREKLFEAYIRMQEIGGEEAKTGMVCMLENIDRLENQLNTLWGTCGRIRIFGLNDLSVLKEKLKDWLNQ